MSHDEVKRELLRDPATRVWYTLLGPVYCLDRLRIRWRLRRAARVVSSITEVNCRCACGWSGTVGKCVPDVDGDGGLGCPDCNAVIAVRVAPPFDPVYWLRQIMHRWRLWRVRAKYRPILEPLDRSERGSAQDAAQHADEIMAELARARSRANKHALSGVEGGGKQDD